MAVEGPVFAGVGANFNDGGTIAWTNPTNAQGDTTATAATVAPAAQNNTSQRLRLSSFGFANIPDNATILGILVEVERSASNASRFSDNSVKLLVGGTEVGTDQSAAAAWSTTKAFVSFGGASSMWGLVSGSTITPADIKGTGFGVSFKGIRTASTAVTASVFRIRITVTFSYNGVSVAQTMSIDAGTNTVATKAFTNPVAIGDLLVVFIRWNEVASGETATCTDSLGNTYTLTRALDDASALAMLNAFCCQVTVAGTPTVTVTLPGSRASVRMAGFHIVNAATANAIEASAGQLQNTPPLTADAISSGNMTQVTPLGMILGFVVMSGSTAILAPGTGFTTGPGLTSFLTEYKLSPSAGTVTATFSNSGGSVNSRTIGLVVVPPSNNITKTGGAVSAFTGGAAKTVLVAKSSGVVSPTVGGASKSIVTGATKTGGGRAISTGGAAKTALVAKSSGGIKPSVGGAGKTAVVAKSSGGVSAGTGGATKSILGVSFPTTPILDDFNRADENPLSKSGAWPASGWIISTSSDLLQVLGNQLAWASFDSSRYWGTTPGGPDQEAYATVAVLPLTGDSVRLWVRISNPTTTNVTGYECTYLHGTGFILRRVDAGTTSRVTLATFSDTLAAGAKFGIQAVGTVLKVFKNTGSGWVQVGSYDTAGDATKYTTGSYVGVEIRDSTIRLDDFGGGLVSSNPYAKVSGAVSPTVGGAIKGGGNVITKSSGAFIGIEYPGGGGYPSDLSGSIGGAARATLIAKSSGAFSAKSPGASKVATVVKSSGGIKPSIGGATKIATVVKSSGGIKPSVGGASKLFVYTKTGGGITAALGGATKQTSSGLAKNSGAVSVATGGAAKQIIGLIAKSSGAVSVASTGQTEAILRTYVKSAGGFSAATTGGAKIVTVGKSSGGVKPSVGGAAKLVIVLKSSGGIKPSIGGASKTTLSGISKSSGAFSAFTGGAQKAVARAKASGGLSAALGGSAKLLTRSTASGAISPTLGGATRGPLLQVIIKTAGAQVSSTGGGIAAVFVLKTAGGILVGVGGGTGHATRFASGAISTATGGAIVRVARTIPPGAPNLLLSGTEDKPRLVSAQGDLGQPKLLNVEQSEAQIVGA